MAKPVDSLRTVNESPHPLVVGPEALPALERKLLGVHPGAKHFLLGDAESLRCCLPELLAHIPTLTDAGAIEIPPGEQSKSIGTCGALWTYLAQHEADRDAVLVCLGGGVITDLGGFVAATYKRGIRCALVPTTLMGMVDAAIGGKTAIDHAGLKNLVGLFAQPIGTYVHAPFLRTLGKRHILNGVAEMIKHGLVADAAHWNAVRRAPLHDLSALSALIARSAAIKANLAALDPHERGPRKLLNFGHSIGHAIEALALESPQRSLLHGEAVAIGMVCETWLSWRLGFLEREMMEAVQEHLFGLYQPFVLLEDDHARVIELMRNDKKNAHGAFRFTLLTGIGSARTDVPVTAAQAMEALDHYRLLARDARTHHHTQD